MPIVLRASLPHEGIFFAGEKFSATLTFTNVPNSPTRDSTPSTSPTPSIPVQQFTTTTVGNGVSGSQAGRIEVTSTPIASAPQPIPRKKWHDPTVPTPEQIAGILPEEIAAREAEEAAKYAPPKPLKPLNAAVTNDRIVLSSTPRSRTTESPAGSTSVPQPDLKMSKSSGALMMNPADPVSKEKRRTFSGQGIRAAVEWLSSTVGNESKNPVVETTRTIDDTGFVHSTPSPSRSGAYMSLKPGKPIPLPEKLDIPGGVGTLSRRRESDGEMLQLQPSSPLGEPESASIVAPGGGAGFGGTNNRFSGFFNDSASSSSFTGSLSSATTLGDAGSRSNAFWGAPGSATAVVNETPKSTGFWAPSTPEKGLPTLPGRAEEITWAFAQMTGNFSIDGTFIKASAFEPLKNKVMYRPANMGVGGFGGGGQLGNPSPHVSEKGSKNSVETRNLPVYTTPPTILFMDLKLQPGESRKFRYEISLPANLPPSHRGKVIRFTYKLVIGIQRGAMNQKTQIIQLPFRLFGRTEEDGSRPVYEIMKPVVITKDDALVVNESNEDQHMQKRQLANQDDAMSPSRSDPVGREDRQSSMLNIINMCQTAAKVSFDICKNNEHVAHLSLLRNAYRLGETVTSIITFSNSSIPCFLLSVYLETAEQIDVAFAARPKQQLNKLTRKVVAEYHKYTLNTKRVSVALSIPITCTPEFQTTAVSVQWFLRMEFVTGVRERLHHITTSDAHFAHYQGMPLVDVESFDCVIPLCVFGSGPAGTRTQSVASFAAQGTAAAAYAAAAVEKNLDPPLEKGRVVSVFEVT
ncbi:Rgp1-domain-containing protein [Cladochytrium replicatum]|nr:Rgp1-domain-containing protein [Cladochytrium replicatum]